MANIVKTYNYEQGKEAVLNPTLSWEVEEQAIYDGEGNVIPEWKSIRRNDDMTCLNICKGSYTPTPNQMLAECAEKLASETGFEIAGFDTYQKGRKVLAFLQNPEENEIAGYKLKDYLLIGNSHDYSSGFWIGNTTMMLRCSNQFTKRNQHFSVSHTTNSKTRIDKLLRSFDAYLQQNKLMYQEFERFVNVPIELSTIDEAIAEVMNISAKEKVSTRKRHLYEQATASIHRECFELGKNLWGLFNGFTHFTTHVKKAKEKTFGNALGGMAEINSKAYQYCGSIAHLN
ncbi:hypothetical protein OKW21_006633 [Catalinimonas alkaloidigena]|uniref:DUF932 domain-containing protein n=1 Tax=Catalinimonas alkaloidigena TaxID=1075417 RepID=UPI0024077256|nr:DUF932 domain-containing protein [Catalinimonas alkaloidigena]MDF9801324.1 hypothetical protein [Catalinimonas alkaloidigena]